MPLAEFISTQVGCWRQSDNTASVSDGAVRRYRDQMGSVGFIFQGYYYMSLACLIAGPIIGFLEWISFGRRTTWVSFAIGFLCGLLLTGVLSAVLISLFVHDEFPPLQSLGQASWMLGFSAIFPYVPLGLVARLLTVLSLKTVFGEGQA